ncbi:MAG: hypothetical protein V3V89_04900, partial [Gammaproteobacteria bacterium]
MRITRYTAFCSGQAMTETLVTAATVLVPLMLLIPLLGKYIDIKHATIQSARYEAWEYTVWYGDQSKTPSGFVDGDGSDLVQRVKSPTFLQNESRRRFFSKTDSTIEPTDGSATWGKDDRNPLWTDHHSDSLIKSGNNGVPARPQEPTPDYTGGIFSVILDILDAVFSALAWVMDLVGSDVGFTMINTKGKSESSVVVPITAPAGLIDFPTLRDTPGVDDATAALNIDYVAKAAVLTDGWTTGGLGHTINQTGGMVPTKILAELIESIPGLDVVWDVVSLLAPEWRRCNPSIPHFLDKAQGTYASWDSGSGDYI